MNPVHYISRLGSVTSALHSTSENHKDYATSTSTFATIFPILIVHVKQRCACLENRRSGPLFASLLGWWAFDRKVQYLSGLG